MADGIELLRALTQGVNNIVDKDTSKSVEYTVNTSLTKKSQIDGIKENFKKDTNILDNGHKSQELNVENQVNRYKPKIDRQGSPFRRGPRKKKEVQEVINAVSNEKEEKELEVNEEIIDNSVEDYMKLEGGIGFVESEHIDEGLYGEKNNFLDDILSSEILDSEGDFVSEEILEDFDEMPNEILDEKLETLSENVLHNENKSDLEDSKEDYFEEEDFENDESKKDLDKSEEEAYLDENLGENQELEDLTHSSEEQEDLDDDFDFSNCDDGFDNVLEGSDDFFEDTFDNPAVIDEIETEDKKLVTVLEDIDKDEEVNDPNKELEDESDIMISDSDISFDDLEREDFEEETLTEEKEESTEKFENQDLQSLQNIDYENFETFDFSETDKDIEKIKENVLSNVSEGIQDDSFEDFDKESKESEESKEELKEIENQIEEPDESYETEEVEEVKEPEETESQIEESDEQIEEQVEEDSEEDNPFKCCVFEKGMEVEEFLQKNSNYREAFYVEHFYSKEYLNKMLNLGLILVKKGKYFL